MQNIFKLTYYQNETKFFLKPSQLWLIPTVAAKLADTVCYLPRQTLTIIYLLQLCCWCCFGHLINNA